MFDIYLAIDLPSFEVVIVDYDYAINGVSMVDMVNEIAFAQIDGDLAYGIRSKISIC